LQIGYRIFYIYSYNDFKVNLFYIYINSSIKSRLV